MRSCALLSDRSVIIRDVQDRLLVTRSSVIAAGPRNALCQSWSSIIPYLLPPSIAIHGILPVHFTCLTVFPTISLQVFFGQPFGLAPSTAYSIHFFTQSLSSFRNTCQYHHNLFCCRTKIMSSNPSLSLNPLLGTLSCHTSISLFLSLPAEVPPHFPLLRVMSHFHATYYFAHNCCTISLLLSMIYPYW